jgi:hypothetical protein
MAAPPKESPYRLLVEGVDDLHSVIHLMARHGFDWDDESKVRPFVSPLEGIEKLLRAVPVALKGSYERVGIVLDANSRLADRWAQIRNRASQAAVSLPEMPGLEGTIVGGRLPGSRVGIWLMPDNSSPGTLENFLGELVSPDHPVWAYAGEATAEAENAAPGVWRKIISRAPFIHGSLGRRSPASLLGPHCEQAFSRWKARPLAASSPGSTASSSKLSPPVARSPRPSSPPPDRSSGPRSR